MSLALATMLHVDWHLARPTHHRLSLGLPQHWAITALVFCAVGWWIGRNYAADRWRVAFVVFVAAVLIAQGVEPVGEVLLYQRRFGYPDEPERWAAFARTIAASIPAFFGCVWLCGRPSRAVPA